MAVSARRKIEHSHLDPKAIQRELLGDDIDVDKFALYLSGKLRTDVSGRIVAADVERTVEGASTLVVVINDYDRAVLRSTLLHRELDVQVDGLWFRIAKIEKDEEGDNITLTFEDREIAILRTYNKLKIVSRQHATRAEFILNLIREVKEERIPVHIPKLHTLQSVATDTSAAMAIDMAIAKSTGISEDETYVSPQDEHRHGEKSTHYQKVLTVKGARASKEQIHNANIILHTAKEMGVRRKVMVCAIMTAITESELHNLTGGDLDSVGLFQQRASWGSFAERHDPATAARLFLIQAHKADMEDPTRPYWDLCATVQHPREDLRTKYNDYRVEGEKFVTAYGVTGGDNANDIALANNMNPSTASGSGYFYYRGKPVGQGKIWKPENSWDCIQRLADEVDWRAFFVSGTFYYMSENDLFAQTPIATIAEFERGVEGIGGDLDTNKKSATASFTVRVGRWQLPPGSVITLKDMGPWDGRWLVNDISRSLFDSKATVTLKKPRPSLPEPLKNDINFQVKSWDWSAVSADPYTGSDKAQFGGIPGTDGSRNAIVKVALAALAEEKKNHYHYAEVRPIPASLFSPKAHAGIDCSGFATLVYKEAGCDDPNGNHYNGSGNTGSLATHGTRVLVPQPGDLVFYGGNWGYPGHVAIFIGNGKVIEIGSDNGILELNTTYRNDLLGYVSYFGGVK